MAAYADPADFAVYALPSAALAAFSSGDQLAALERASRVADSYIRSRSAVPLGTWGADLRAAVCDLAAYQLLTRLGFDSADEGSAFRKRFDDALAWLRDVAKGVASVSGDATTPAPTPAARVRTSPRRGWPDGTCDD
jgi:phage gp36-like protein